MTGQSVWGWPNVPHNPFAGSFQEGGRVPRTGLALVHEGEYVLSKGQKPEVQGDIYIENHFTINGTDKDPTEIAREVAREVKRIIQGEQVAKRKQRGIRTA